MLHRRNLMGPFWWFLLGSPTKNHLDIDFWSFYLDPCFGGIWRNCLFFLVPTKWCFDAWFFLRWWGHCARVSYIFGCDKWMQVARMSRTGFKLYTALTNNRPSASEMLKAFRLFVECVPLTRLSHVFLNLAIMHAIGDAKRVHIVDYGILYGVQWPCFIYHFSRLPGPPHLRITGILILRNCLS
jgi:hypothetical protein